MGFLEMSNVFSSNLIAIKGGDAPSIEFVMLSIS